ncbi:MAG: DUF559 domain-containing protein [Pseudomonadota bacterium]
MPHSAIPDWQRQQARQRRQSQTPAQHRLWQGLRRLNRAKRAHFRRQAPIGPFLVDFVDLRRRLIVETGLSRQLYELDQSRATWLGEQGFRRLAFTDRDIFRDLNAVLTSVSDALVQCKRPR